MTVGQGIADNPRRRIITTTSDSLSVDGQGERALRLTSWPVTIRMLVVMRTKMKEILT